MADDELVHNAADAGQVKEARRKEKEQRRNELKDLVHLLKDPVFRRFAWRMLGFCKLNQTVFTTTDPVQLGYNSGKQDVGHFLLSEITTAQPESFLQMMQENHRGEDT